MTFQRKRKNKYNNVKTVIDGMVFDSKKEGNRYLELKILERAGKIKRLKTQVPLPVILNDQKICKFVADFEYYEDGEQIIEDVKSEITRKNPVYRLKKKLIEALYNLKIRET